MRFMDRRPALVLLLCAGVIGLAPRVADATQRWIPLGPGQEGSAPVVSVARSQDSVVVELSFSGFYAEDVERDGGAYTVVSIPECGLAGAVGAPELPFRSVLVPVPNGPQVRSVAVIGDSRTALSGVTVAPRRAPEPDCGAGAAQPGCDPKVYGQDAWLPGDPVSALDDVVVRGQRFLRLEISPLEFNPLQGTLRARPQLEVRIDLAGEVDEAAEQLKVRRVKPFFPTLVDLPANDAGSVAVPTGVEYLIIAHDSLAAAIEPLAEWKRLQGFTVEIVPSSAVGTTSTQIKSFLQARYLADPDLTYVLLVGDHPQIPAQSLSGFVSDLYYSCLDGSDYLADVVIGRLSVQTPADCSNVVAKILAYERTPDQGDWHGNFLMAAYLQDYNDGNCTADRWFYETGTRIMHFVRDVVGLGIDTAATSDHLGCNPYRWRSDGYPHRPAGYSGETVPTDDVALLTSASTSTQDVTAAINAGVTIVQHRDHGGENGWGDPPYSNSNVNALANGDRTPVVFSTNCLTGTFDWGSGDCFAEAFMKKYPGGAVGIMAATEVSYSGYNDLLAHGTYDCLWDGYDPADGGNMYPHSFRPAEATLYGKYYMSNWEGFGDSLSRYQCEIFHWFGDPELEVYTAVPVAPAVTLPPTLPVASSTLEVTCDAEGATVAVTDQGVLVGRATVTGGTASVTLEQPPEEPTELDVVISGHNLVAWQGSVQVIVPAGPWLAYRAHTLDDTAGGDGDGIVNPGEAVVMGVMVENIGAEDGSDLAGVLTTTSGDATVTDAAATFPDLAVNAQGMSDPDHFSFVVAASAANGSNIPFSLDWSAAPDYTGSTGFAVPVCEHLAISDVAFGGVTEQSALVSWTTNVPATSSVRYGTSEPLTEVVEDPFATTSHSLQITGLTQCTAYLVEVGSVSPACYEASDDAGGAFHRFTTGAGAPLSATSADTPVSIPDNNPAGAIATVEVDSDYAVADVNLTISITHTYTGDLNLYLIGPDGTEVELSTRNGGTGENYAGTVFDDEADQPITAASAPFIGSFQPEHPLAAFDGRPADGTWTFKVVDAAGYDVGTIDGFQLDLVVAEPCDSTLFSDGFESGTTDAWTVTLP